MRILAGPVRAAATFAAQLGVSFVVLAAGSASAQVTITSIVPSSGPVAGGTRITISGTNLSDGFSTSVEVGGLPAVVESQSAASLTVLTPGQTSAGPRDVVVASEFGSVTRTGGFTYTFSASVRRQDRTSTGGNGSGGTYEPSLSGDGRYLAFSASWAHDSGLGLSGGNQVFVRDRVKEPPPGTPPPWPVGTLVRISEGPAGEEPNGPSGRPRISADGRFVAFWSDASNLVAGDTEGHRDVFVHDRDTDADGIFDEPGQRATFRVSVGPLGVAANGASAADGGLDISPEGLWVAFTSVATNLLGAGVDTNGVPDVFLHSLESHQTSRVSVATGGTQALGGASRAPSVSRGGLFVAFASDATNLVANDTLGFRDVFVHDRLANATLRLTQLPSGQSADGASDNPSIDDDGLAVALQTASRNLVPELAPSTKTQVVVFSLRLGALSGGTVVPGRVHAAVTNIADAIRRVLSGSGGGAAAQQPGNGASVEPEICASGECVTYATDATNLNEGADDDQNTQRDVVLQRIEAAPSQAERISKDVAGNENSDAGSSRAAVDQHGGVSAVQSEADLSDPSGGFALGGGNVFVRGTSLVVSRVSPSFAYSAVGDQVAVIGGGFEGGVAVKLGTTNVTTFFDAPTSIRFRVDANVLPPGAYDLTVSNTNGDSRSVPSAFRLFGSPTVTGVSPPAGPVAGGTLITVTGTEFVAGQTLVSVGGTAATGVTVLSPTSLTALTPPGTAGAKAVAVTTQGGVGTLASAFTYQASTFTLAVTGAGGGSGSVTSQAGVSPPIACAITGGVATGDCGASYADGTVVTLSATPGLGSSFTGWAGACTGTGPCAVTMSAARSVTATFVAASLPLFTLTVTGAGAGSGTVASLAGLSPAIACTSTSGTSSGTCSASYTDGTSVTLTANPAVGSTFSGWSGACTGTGNCQVTMSAARDVVVSFAPASAFRQYLAEGATTGFETRISIANPGVTAANVRLTFQRRDSSARTHVLTVPARQSRKVTVSQLPEMDNQEFSTLVESDQAVVVDRQMWWDKARAYGTHAESAVAAPAATWYFAEGATHSGFDLFYLLQNAADTEATVRVRYLRPAGAPVEKTYLVPPRSRFNIWVDNEAFPEGSANTLLSNTDVSAVVEVLAGPPIIAERAMYQTPVGAALFESGHESAGVLTPSTTWFLAEGATGSYFDTFVLVANPFPADAQVRGTYLLPDGRTFSKTYTIAANSRFNVWVDLEQFDGVVGFPLADTAVSTTIESINGVPVIVERSMWWPGPTPATWTEAHNAPGSTLTGSIWAFAEGIVTGPPGNTDTYYLVANTGSSTARIRVTLLFDDGGPEVSREFDVLPRSRFNVYLRGHFPESVGRGFGAVIESLGDTPAPIVVERAMYNDADGVTWRAGSNALGTRLK